MLHLCNGDAVAQTLRTMRKPRSRFGHVVVPWRDLLYDGPVPDGLAPGALRRTRASFIAAQGWGAEDEVCEVLARRDEALARFPEHEETVLWFDHDVSSQLQMLQILDRIGEAPHPETRVALICIGEREGDPGFVGLGRLHAEQLAELWDARADVTQAQYALAKDAWRAFRRPDPAALEAVLSRDTSALPFLRPVIARLLQQYPDVTDGLTRTERSILQSLDLGPRQAAEIFAEQCQMEAVPFLSDLSFWACLRRLASGRRPAVRLEAVALGAHFGDSLVALTDEGRLLLDGAHGFVEAHGIECYVGGVRLSGPRPSWCWNEAAQRLERCA